MSLSFARSSTSFASVPQLSLRGPLKLARSLALIDEILRALRAARRGTRHALDLAPPLAAFPPMLQHVLDLRADRGDEGRDRHDELAVDLNFHRSPFRVVLDVDVIDLEDDVVLSSEAIL